MKMKTTKKEENKLKLESQNHLIHLNFLVLINHLNKKIKNGVTYRKTFKIISKMPLFITLIIILTITL